MKARSPLSGNPVTQASDAVPTGSRRRKGKVLVFAGRVAHAHQDLACRKGISIVKDRSRGVGTRPARFVFERLSGRRELNASAGARFSTIACELNT
jgi:hypothetical protein